MARKQEEIRLLAMATAEEVTENADAWKQYLNTAARLYRYPFMDQLLIYAQRPGATACASIDIWNEKMHCWVNKGAKGIALLDEEGLTANGVKYVFDVADVHESRFIGRRPHLWQMEPKYEEAVVTRLEHIYGVTEPSALLENRLIEIADRIATEYAQDVLPELMQGVDGSKLDGLSEEDIAIRFRETLKASVAYTLFERCGMDVEPWEEDLNFSHITDFNTMDTLSVLGNATSELSEPVLKEIGRTITVYDRGQWNEVHAENLKTSLNPSKGLENAPDASYYSLNPVESAAVDESIETANETSQSATERAERSAAYGTDIQTERGLSDSEPEGERGTGRDADEVRADAETLSEGTPQRDVHGDDAGRDAEGTLSDDTEPGRGADGLPDRADGEDAGRERGVESVRPDEVGETEQQHQSVGGGDRFIGADLQLSEAETEQLSLFPTIEEQQKRITAAEAKRNILAPAAVSLPEDDLDSALMRGSMFSGGKMRIYALYRYEENPAKRAEFLKKEYGMGGHSHTLMDGRSGFVDYSGKGIQIAAFKADYEVRYTWRDAEKRIKRLIDHDAYLTDRDKQEWAALEEKYAEVGGVPYPKPAFRMPEPEEIIKERDSIGADDGFEPAPEELSSLFEDEPETPEVVEAAEQAMTSAVESSEPATTEAVETSKPAAGRFSIYQIKETSDLGEFMFESHAFMEREGLVITADKYDHVYTADTSILPGETTDIELQMEQIFTKFNVDRPEDFEGHSLSMSDVIVFHEADGNDRAFYVDTIGFKEITESFFKDRERDQVQETPVLSESEATVSEPAPQSAEQGVIPAYQEGDTVTIDGTAFIVENVGDLNIELRDPTLVYPILRAESIEHFEEMLRTGEAVVTKSHEQEVKLHDVVIDLTPRSETEEEIPAPDLLPEQMTLQQAAGQQETAQEETPKSRAENFRITDDDLGIGGAKEKFRRNMDAIYLLKTLEDENRQATPEEQQVLSQYVGWGGLSDVFDPSKADWKMQFEELKASLTQEEYNAAMASTLNAHYTSPTVIKAMYEAIGNMGFTKGNILEPSCGVGNFLGLLPESMQESRMYGVELDSVSGRIAKQLYPQSDITVGGFETTDHRDFYDLAIGNVPFGNYKVYDQAYNKLNFNIHNYFFAKALDQVRPGGVVAFVTSRYTMDSASPEVRKYLAQRADLLGAIRLPNNAFKANAGTEVVSDIIFLQKRDRVIDIEPEWVHLDLTEQGHRINSYFTEHPEMVLGEETEESTQYGWQDYTVKAIEGESLSERLHRAVQNIQGQIEAAQIDEDELENDVTADFLPADPNVKNYSYCLVDDQVYYRENSVMKPVRLPETQEGRIKGLIALRNCTQELITLQMEDFSDAEIMVKQAELNRLYDDFTKQYGLISAQGNKRVFNQDASYCLLCSLEKLDDEGNFKGKADMFTKRTIKRAQVVESVDTASEALAVSLSEKAKVDLDYMVQLTGKTKEEITDELTGVIFQNPLTDKWETADEYLSGNVRVKLETARSYAENHPEYAINVQALERVQPKDLDASEIDVRLGAPWVDKQYIEDFMREVLQTPYYHFRHRTMGVLYSDVTGQWNVKGKNADYGNALANVTYGTNRANAYKLLEDALNLKDTRSYDTVVEDGKEKRVLNKKETMLASQKQDALREAFKEWIFKDQERREELVKKYNELFNSTRPREYDGSHLTFPGMSPDIDLKPHQLNAVAHVLYGDNTLLAHAVGAGKTFEMAAAAMESKRLGLSQKSLFVVPNHLTEQWAADFLRLYPGANILAATKKDFEPANRKKFCSRIATGDYDAVIIGHSQFEKIPLSDERQAAIIQKQINDIETAIALAKAERGERYTIKQMEKSKRMLETKLQKLNDKTRKDNVVTFEQLGVDHIYVDESHAFKNLFLYTKMRNVAGIAQTEAQKSQDMFNKCQYLDELTGGRGVTFATGTPISNSMTELYTNMRYLQYGTLQRLGLGQFDAWAATFGETQTAIELAPEGTGYRAKTRFAKFFNLPELVSLFKEAADIQTADMLDLKIPDVEYENVVLKPSEAQKEMVASLAERAERVRNSQVDASVDNMLKITNDGRKLALDQRLVNDLLEDHPGNKSSVCVEKAFEIWQDTKAERSAQLIFCDLSTPKGDGTFSVYEDIRDKLVAKGVPPEEIAFIHDANTDHRKAELFAKVRSGQVRFLLGSTAKMGAGTNVQDRLIALHHLDVPWRPSDIEQQEGRILRQGNTNPRVKIFRYVTEGTFDAYSWQVIENKQKFISQIMTSKSPVRACDDIDEAALTYAEVKALATGNPHIKEKMDLDIQVSKLKLLKANHTSQIYRLEDNIAKNYPKQIATLQERIEGFKKDIATYNANKPADKEQFTMTVAGKTYEDKKEAGAALIAVCKEMKQANTAVPVGEYLGMKMSVTFDAFDKKFTLSMKGEISHAVEVGSDPLGNITRIGNAMEGMTARLEEAISKLANTEKQLATAKEEVTKPFPQEEELKVKSARLAELNALLNMDEKDDSVLDVDEDAPKPVQTEQETERQEPTAQEQEERAQVAQTGDNLIEGENNTHETETQEKEDNMTASTGYEEFDTPIKEHDHNEVPPERTVAEKMVQPQILEPDATPVTAEQLAAEIDRFMEDVDPYNYKDTVENREEYLQILAAQIKDGDTESICDYLQGIIEEESGTEEQLAQAKVLLDKVNEYKPLAKVEEIEEQNYNMVDNVLNNGAGEKEEKKQRERVHFKDKLKEKKDEIAAKKDGTEPSPEKTKKPPHHEV